MDEAEVAVCKKTPNYVAKLKKLLETKTKCKKAAIFSHHCPDPDAIGSMMGLEWLLSKYEIESVLFFSGKISHPQNNAMVNLLDPNLKPISEYNPDDFDFHCLVDTVPSHAGIGNNKIDFDLVVDHHKEMLNGNFAGLFINLKAGSACGTIFDMLTNLGHAFEDDNDHDARVATALMVGIATDTDTQMSEDSTEYEFQAWSKLFNFKVPALKQIVNYRRPKTWVKTEALAVSSAAVHEGVGVVGLGMLTEDNRDMISDMADAMATWEDVNTAIVFAVIDGRRVEGSVRSNNASIPVPDLCKQLGGTKFGGGGGKLGKGAYQYDLAGGGIDEDDDEADKEKTWQLLNEKERKRIFRLLERKV